MVKRTRQITDPEIRGAIQDWLDGPVPEVPDFVDKSIWNLPMAGYCEQGALERHVRRFSCMVDRMNRQEVGTIAARVRAQHRSVINS